MTNTTITALAAAHAALKAEAAKATPAASAETTARRVETTLVELLAAQGDKLPAETALAVMESGSIKAIKALPKAPIFANNGWRRRINAVAIVQGGTSYLKEATARGFTFTSDDMEAIVQQALSGGLDTNGAAIRNLMTQAPIMPHVFEGIIGRFFAEENAKESDAWGDGRRKPVANPVAGAALVAPLLKKALRDPKRHDVIAQVLRHICALPELSIMGKHAIPLLVTFALAGAKAPPKGAYENREVEAFAKAIFGAQRKDLIAATGGLEAWLAGGWRTPPAIVADLEAKRKRATPVARPTRRW